MCYSFLSLSYQHQEDDTQFILVRVHLECSEQDKNYESGHKIVDEIPGVCGKPVTEHIDSTHKLKMFCLKKKERKT